MSLNFSVTPGKIFAVGEKPTTAKLNQLGVPVIVAQGVIGPGDMGVGNYDAVLGPGAYVYAAATLAGTNYTAAYNPILATYTDGLWLAFKVNAANPAAATLDAGAGIKPLYTAGGSRVPDAGEIPASSIVQVRYNTSLNAASGGWQIISVLRDRVLNEFGGASAQAGGLRGIVPRPLAGQQTYVLRATGLWESITADIDARIAVSTAATSSLPLYLAVNY